LEKVLMRRAVTTAFLVLVAVGVAACASTSNASPEMTEAAKNFEAPDDKGLVFLYRTGRMVGAAGAIEVSVNGQAAGGTGPGTFFRWELEPGSYTFHSSTGEASATVALEVEAGAVYFIEQNARMGLNTGRVSMEEVDAQRGRSQVSNMQLLVSAYVPSGVE
jgi:hypothetical protein